MPSVNQRTIPALIVVCAVLVGGGLSASVSAATLTGQKCNSVGATRTVSAVRFKCAKVKGKLVWTRIARPTPTATATPTPTPTVTPTPTPTPTPKPTPSAWAAPIPITLPIPTPTEANALTFANIVDRVPDIPLVAWEKTQQVLSTNAAHAMTIDMHIGPNTRLDFPGGEMQIRDALQRTTRLWKGFGQSPYITVLAYNATDEPWAEKTWLDVAQARRYVGADGAVTAIRGQCQASSAPGQFSGAITECRGSNTGSVLDSDDAVMMLGMTGTSTDLYFLSAALVSHEYTHAAQAGQWIGAPNCTNAGGRCFRSGMSNAGFSPCWLFEGLPNSSSRLVMADSFARYQALREGLAYGWGPTTVTDYKQPSLRDYLFNQVPATCYQNGELYKLGYSIGALTTEALIAIGGPQAVMALYALGASGSDFPTAFQKVYGLPWSEAALVLSKVVAAEYVGFGPPPF